LYLGYACFAAYGDTPPRPRKFIDVNRRADPCISIAAGILCGAKKRPSQCRSLDRMLAQDKLRTGVTHAARRGVPSHARQQKLAQMMLAQQAMEGLAVNSCRAGRLRDVTAVTLQNVLDIGRFKLA